MENKLNLNQQEFLNKYVIGSWNYNPTTNLVDVKGNFHCVAQGYSGKIIPSDGFMGIKFGIVSGYFNCRSNGFISLEGAPYKTGKGFDCSNNQLTSLNGAPRIVGGEFNCRANIGFNSLIGAPYKISKGSFKCDFMDSNDKYYVFNFKANEWNILGWIGKIEQYNPKSQVRKLLFEMAHFLVNRQIQENPADAANLLIPIWHNMNLLQKARDLEELV